ncbi:hypothetical protein LRP52_44550 [Photobacterium sp. ZSDE20]|uniref:Uncharacterized protein n=1 Tax=Photobacterium pectinilyticum TaxID=2906793 RepID=A0ABT1NBA0_9GAMM|nr:hypothetical protein [Photobacterium sp. ZSDE20]MCQ1061109.1 hypothetical protein [Photobacterium sp. ZSDE20]MDD1829241.1 hypothetical protein [Photobacterium sp. ZSDE20]
MNKVMEKLKSLLSAFTRNFNKLFLCLSVLSIPIPFYVMFVILLPQLHYGFKDDAHSLIALPAAIFVVVLCCYQIIKGRDNLFVTGMSGMMCIGVLTMFNVITLWGFSDSEKYQSVRVEGDTIIFEPGSLEFSTAIELDYILLTNSDLNKAMVTGPGGRTDSAYYMKYRLEKNGIKQVHAYGDTCFSACTVLWTAGEQRTIDDGLFLGFHKSTSGDKVSRVNAHLYKNFLNDELINIIASPDQDYGCPLDEDYISILEGEDSPQKSNLIQQLKDVCSNNKVTFDDLQNFDGYII